MIFRHLNTFYRSYHNKFIVKFVDSYYQPFLNKRKISFSDKYYICSLNYSSENSNIRKLSNFDFIFKTTINDNENFQNENKISNSTSNLNPPLDQKPDINSEKNVDKKTEAKPSLWIRFKNKSIHFYHNFTFKLLWIKIKNEAIHYYHGFRLLLLEIRITLGILNRLTMGHYLTRRERKQLVRTVADIARMVPFLVFIIVPCMELLLPVYVKLFPFMMPSTFKEESKQKEEVIQIMKGKLEIAKFLQEAISAQQKTTKKTADGTEQIDMETFGQFLKQVREQGLTANTKDILKFSKFFEDEVTLESMDIKQLKALCNLLSINSIGPASLLTFQLRLRVRQLKADDRLLQMEGLDKVPVWELQQLCRERGMRAVGVSEQRLRYQLEQWLDLHLVNEIPITLLLLTRVMYLPHTLTPEEQLKQAIFNLPVSVSNEAKLKVAKTKDEVDSKTKIEIIKEEQKIIKKERIQAKKDKEQQTKDSTATAETVSAESQSDTTKKVIIEKESKDTAPDVVLEQPIKDRAPYIIDKMQTVDATQMSSPPVSSEISATDLAKIESAIVSLEESEIGFQKQELKSLKENQEKLMKLPEVVHDTPSPNKSKTAERLNQKVSQLIKDMDVIVDKLHSEKSDLIQEIKEKETIIEVYDKNSFDEISLLKAIEFEKDKLIDINDLMINLRKIQKLPEDFKWQQILEVLDDNHDGKIDKNLAIQVIKILSEENVKLSKQEILKVVEMINKESKLEELTKSHKEGLQPDNTDKPSSPPPS